MPNFTFPIINLFFMKKQRNQKRIIVKFSLIVENFFDHSKFIHQLGEVINKFVEDWKFFFSFLCKQRFHTLRNGLSLINIMSLDKNFQLTLEKSNTGFAHFLDTHFNKLCRFTVPLILGYIIPVLNVFVTKALVQAVK